MPLRRSCRVWSQNLVFLLFLCPSAWLFSYTSSPRENNWKLIQLLPTSPRTQVRTWLFFTDRFPFMRIIAPTFPISTSCPSLCAPDIVAMAMILKQNTSLLLKRLWHFPKRTAISKCQRRGRFCSLVNYLANFAEFQLSKQNRGQHVKLSSVPSASGIRVEGSPEYVCCAMASAAPVPPKGRHISISPGMGFRSREALPCSGRCYNRGLACALPFPLYGKSAGRTQGCSVTAEGMLQKFRGKTSVLNVQAAFQEQYPASFYLCPESERCIWWPAPKISPFFSRWEVETLPQNLGMETQM